MGVRWYALNYVYVACICSGVKGHHHRSVFQFTGSVLEVCGNLLVILSILYALLHLGLRYGNLSLFPVWNGDCERRFKEICVLMATLSVVLYTGGRSVVESRHSNPKVVSGGLTCDQWLKG